MDEVPFPASSVPILPPFSSRVCPHQIGSFLSLGFNMIFPQMRESIETHHKGEHGKQRRALGLCFLVSVLSLAMVYQIGLLEESGHGGAPHGGEEVEGAATRVAAHRALEEELASERGAHHDHHGHHAHGGSHHHPQEHHHHVHVEHSEETTTIETAHSRTSGEDPKEIHSKTHEAAVKRNKQKHQHKHAQALGGADPPRRGAASEGGEGDKVLCAQVYQPVCDTRKKKTHSNRCMALAAGAAEGNLREGECEEEHRRKEEEL